MNLKTSNQLAIENFEPIVNSYDLKLLGSPSPYSNDTNSFYSIFGDSAKFFYRVAKLKNSIVSKYEVGLGYLEDNILKRSKPLYHGLSGEPLPSTNGPQYFIADKDETLIVTSHIPANLNELLCDANSVVTSIAPHISHPLHIPNQSFLGRLDDNVQSIPFSDLFSHPELIAAILQVITTYSKQLSLRTSKLDAKRVCTDCLQLNTSDKPLDKKNSLIFDGENLKFYDGEKWMIIQWKNPPT